MPLMPMPPIPTKWTRCFFSNIEVQHSGARSQNSEAPPAFWILDSEFWILYQLVTLIHDLSGCVRPAEPPGRPRHRREPRAVAVKGASAASLPPSARGRIISAAPRSQRFGVNRGVVRGVRMRTRIAGFPARCLAMVAGREDGARVGLVHLDERKFPPRTAARGTPS